jgi:hypothetical protein
MRDLSGMFCAMSGAHPREASKAATQRDAVVALSGDTLCAGTPG